MTNYERIQKLSKKDLAYLLKLDNKCAFCAYGHGEIFDKCKHHFIITHCFQGILEFLDQEQSEALDRIEQDDEF